LLRDLKMQTSRCCFHYNNRTWISYLRGPLRDHMSSKPHKLYILILKLSNMFLSRNHNHLKNRTKFYLTSYISKFNVPTFCLISYFTALAAYNLQARTVQKCW
jgi:hypothetical protein